MFEIGIVIVGALTVAFLMLVMQVLKEQFAEIRSTLIQQGLAIEMLRGRVTDRAAEITDAMHRIGRVEGRVKTIEDETDPIEFTEIEKNLKEALERVTFLEKITNTLTKFNDALEKKTYELVTRVTKLEETSVTAVRVASLDVRVARLETMNDKVVQALAPQNQPRRELPRIIPSDVAACPFPPKADTPLSTGPTTVWQVGGAETGRTSSSAPNESNSSSSNERKCVTHHHACDCRERMMKRLMILSRQMAGELNSAMQAKIIESNPRLISLISELNDLDAKLGY